VEWKPKAYQREALDWLIQKLILSPESGAALLLDPGLGKTSITLAFFQTLKAMGLAKKMLIVAPLRVCHSVWPGELEKWDQFRGLKAVFVNKPYKLESPADIYLVNPESLHKVTQWIADKRKNPFEMLVVDESSRFKSWGAVCSKLLRSIIKTFRYRLALTGTPAPNSLEDLFSQIYLVDLGKSLGQTITPFREKYFYRGGYGGYEWLPLDTSQAQIEARIAPVCLRLAAKDHLDLPELVVSDIWVDLPKDTRKIYAQLEKELFAELTSNLQIVALNAGAKYQKCKQIANGGFYHEGKAVHLHSEKIEALEELVGELQGKPLLVAFQYKHDLERIQKVWPRIPFIDGTVSGKTSALTIDAWNAGLIQILAVQPQALSHGVNMQSGPGRDIAWLGLSDSLETWIQFNARIYRQGVTGQVRIHRILAAKTVDLVGLDNLEQKDETQANLLEALNRYREKLLT